MGAIKQSLLVTLAASALVSSTSAAHAQAVKPAAPRIIHFSGYDWEVRPDADGGPGPNHWDPSNVRVDSQGRLHVTLTRRGGVWHCAEATTLRSFGFGLYQFQVTGALDRLDPNVVFGLFDYPPPGGGPDGTNEIDIEYSRWGDPAAVPASTTIYPAHLGPASVSHPFPMPPGLADTTQRFVRRPDAVSIQCLRGHRDDNQGEYSRWEFRPADNKRLPQQPLPVHINLWLVRGKAPQDGKEVEVVVKQFSFMPATP